MIHDFEDKFGAMVCKFCKKQMSAKVGIGQECKESNVKVMPRGRFWIMSEYETIDQEQFGVHLFAECDPEEIKLVIDLAEQNGCSEVEKMLKWIVKSRSIGEVVTMEFQENQRVSMNGRLSFSGKNEYREDKFEQFDRMGEWQ